MGKARRGARRSDSHELGTNLRLLGAIRLTGWVVLKSQFATANKDRFVAWVKRKLLPKLKRGDVVVMDNLRSLRALTSLTRADELTKLLHTGVSNSLTGSAVRALP